MKYETIKALAIKTKISVDDLLKQFSKIGIKKNANDILSNKEKNTLLEYINNKNNNNKNMKKMILKRKTRSVLNVLKSNGKNKLINIEVRKKCVLFSKIENNKEKIIKDEQINEKKIKNVKKDKIEKKYKKDLIINKKKKKEEKEINLKKKKNNKKKDKINYKKIEKKNKKILNKKIEFWKNNYHSEKDENKNDIFYYKKNKNYLKEKNIKTKNKNIKNNKKYIKKIKKEKILKLNKKKIKKVSSIQQVFIKPTSKINRVITVGKTIYISELAKKMALKSFQLVKIINKMGVLKKIDEKIDQETAQLIIEEMGHKVILTKENELENSIFENEDKKKLILESRTPIVTIMGHVDHGKTSLLDYILSKNIQKNEIGGITQSIGAHYVKLKKGIITFLDTPGHEAFEKMRSRVAKITDIIVLVIAIDDGVMPQTIEVINHAKKYKIPIIVAINKIDKQNENIENIKNELLKYNIISEEWGGENQFINISVKKGIGINELLDSIFLTAEILELKAAKNTTAKGVVIESYLDKGRGAVASILIQEGILRKGDIVLCGLVHGNIRSILNQHGKEIEFSGPSEPIEIIGLSSTPISGDKIIVINNEKKAKEIANYRKEKIREKNLEMQQKSKLRNFFEQKNHKEYFVLNIVLKSNTQGSCEAIMESLKMISDDKNKIKIISYGVGFITENDVSLALSCNAIIVGFRVKINNIAKEIIKKENLNFYCYSIIYDLIKKIKKIIKDKVKKEIKQKIIGVAEVKNVFKSGKNFEIAGCIVISGIIKKNHPIKILRKNKLIHEDFCKSLKHFKENVKELKIGLECGIIIKNFNKFHINDTIKFYESVK